LTPDLVSVSLKKSQPKELMQKLIALDIEVGSLEARHDSSIVFYCAALYSDEFRTVCTTLEELSTAVSDLLQQGYKFIVHNAAFDIACLRIRGIDIPAGSYVCTQVMHYCHNTDDNHGLDYLAEKYLGERKQDIKTKLIELGILNKKSKKADVFNFDYLENEEAYNILCSYCLQDAKITYGLYHKLVATLSPNELEVFNKLELPYIEVIMQMNTTGMYFDREKLSVLRDAVQVEIDELTEKVNTHVGLLPASVSWDGSKYVPFVKEYAEKNQHRLFNYCPIDWLNPGSNQLPYYLMERCGWKPTEVSKIDGQPVLDKQAVAKIKDKFPILETTSKLQERKKLQSSFVQNLLDRTENSPVVFASYNQTRTKTTRLSASDPNFQQIPSRDKLSKTVRECVIAPKCYDLWVADLDQIELKVLAYYLLEVGETRMADAIYVGTDLHQVNGDAWGVSRSDAKKIFSVIYGGQAAAVGAYGNGGTPEEGQIILDKMKSGMPAIWDLMELVWKKARANNCYVRTLLGSTIHYPELNSPNKWLRQEAERQSFNSLIQGSAANINKYLGLKISPLIQECGGRMAFAVHDEYGAYIPTENRDKFSSVANSFYRDIDIMCELIPTTGDWHYGSNWALAKAG
jgi:DNA polymerase I